MPVQQVQPHDLFPSGDYRDLAEIGASPDELAARFGLVFAKLLDDLDWFKLAAIALPDGSQLWLIKYRGDQYPGTLVRVDAGADLTQPRDQLAQVLGLTRADFLWVAPELETPAALA